MKRIASTMLLCSAFVLSSASCADPSATIVGTANYVASFTLGKSAVFEDVSIADAPAQRIGRTVIQSPGGAPLAFSIAYDPHLIDSTHHYAVRARIKDGDRVLFATQASYPVLADPSATHVDIELREVASASDPVGAVADMKDVALENTYWKLMRVGTTNVSLPSGTREIHFTLEPNEARASGFAGCNTFTGTYTLNGDHLVFGNL